MAEVFGIVAGGIGIATAFSTCVDCFNYVQLGRNFGRDYQTNTICFELLGLRLSRWGEAVNVQEDPMLGNPNAAPAQLKVAKDTLLQILVLFEDSHKLSRSFKETPKADELIEYGSSDMEPSMFNLHNRMRAVANKRQKNASLLKVTKWTVYSGPVFEKLLSDIVRLVDGLEILFPAPSTQQKLVRQDIETIANDEHREADLEFLNKVASQVDKLLEITTTSALQSSNTLRNSKTTGQAKVLVGNIWSDIWAGSSFVPKSMNVAEGVTTEANCEDASWR